MALFLLPASFTKKFVQKIFLLTILFLFSPAVTHAVETTYQAKVINIIEEKQVEVMGVSQPYQKLELQFLSGDLRDQKTIIESGNQPLANIPHYRLNDRVIVTRLDAGYVISDFVRQDSLILLFIIFLVLILLITGWKGLSSVFGMVFTFVVLFAFVLPQISMGKNPVIIATISSLVIIPISFYLSHGLNLKTTIAIIGSSISLIFTALMAYWFINLTSLTGISSEEAGMLSIDRQGGLNMKGILLAAIVIGALGVLDDIAVSQASIVDELSRTAKLTKFKDLYTRSMVIGKDHIASMVNTLVLAYAGVSLPLLLIFVDNPRPLGETLNLEMISEEIVRTLVGSIGLVIAVPITTFIAALVYSKYSLSSAKSTSLGR